MKSEPIVPLFTFKVERESVFTASRLENELQKATKVETCFECSLYKVALCPAMCHNEFHAAPL